MLKKVWKLNQDEQDKYEKIVSKDVLKGAQVWDFDVLDFNDFFIMKSL